ncbi:mismatch repair protein MSH5 [Trypanosoma theileri]|uniref:Mismatch repair protein MSH5 n=1 Tax=Trypanosoma theileri TaxID=67003 RepID=A0A1X0NZW5_9TRYP|nr:mismatch repair protein MSH5 [Trypanosoma theileri]ORC90236.1 mismatch repair protein MSH5 [Trypanosoma theileri]
MDDFIEDLGVVEVASVLIFRHSVGLAFYNSGTCQVNCCETSISRSRTDEVPIRSFMDIPSDLMWVSQFLTVMRPQVLLVPSAGSQVLLDVAELCSASVRLTAPREFDECRIWEILSAFWADVTRLEWHSRICPQNHVMLMALCALLSYLQHNESPVADVVEVPPLGLFYVDHDTLLGLQLLRTEPHPMDFQGIGRSKEGLSLLSVVDRTCSQLGKSLLRQWFALPLRDEEELQRRYDVVSFFTKPENFELMKQLRRSLQRIRYPSSIFTKMRAAKHTLNDYESLLRSIKGYLRVASLLSPQAHILPTFLRIVASCQISQLEEMSRLINEGISFSRDPSEALSKTCVHILPGFDSVLDELRIHSARLDEVLTTVAQEESRSLPPEFGPCTVVCVFIPQWGYVITVPHFTYHTGENIIPPNWELLLQSDEGYFFKTPLTRLKDEELGDVRSAVLDREGEIQRFLDRRLLELSPALIPLYHCAELDCLMGFAMCALEGQWNRPEIVQEGGVLVIDRGVHPIFARASVHQVVPYSLTIRNSTQRICVVTGANGSGKSVFITAVAQTVFLAHIGSFVPCVHATIGLTDTVMSLQTASTGSSRGKDLSFTAKELHSSFGSELVSMSRMLQRCSSRNKENEIGSRRSLFVLDEFGKGTLSMDGAALLAASIRSFIGMGDQRPIVLLATHYSEIIHPDLVPRDEILLLEMLTTLSGISHKKKHETNEYDEFNIGEQQLVHSYRVEPVQGTDRNDFSQKNRITSHALHFALQLSVPAFLVQRAWEVIITEEL